jgi:hypothetical protein
LRLRVMVKQANPSLDRKVVTYISALEPAKGLTHAMSIALLPRAWGPPLVLELRRLADANPRAAVQPVLAANLLNASEASLGLLEMLELASGYCDKVIWASARRFLTAEQLSSKGAGELLLGCKKWIPDEDADLMAGIIWDSASSDDLRIAAATVLSGLSGYNAKRLKSKSRRLHGLPAAAKRILR